MVEENSSGRVETLARGIEAQSKGDYTLLRVITDPPKFNGEPHKTDTPREAADFFTEAIARFSEIQYPSGQASALCRRAICLQMLGEPDRASEDFSTALRISPRDQRTRLENLGRCYSLRIET